MTLIDLEDFYARWQRLLPFSNETRPHVIREQLLNELPWNKERVVKKEAKNNQGSYVVEFSGLDPSLGCAPFQNELRRYSAQRCTTVPEIASSSGMGVIVDCKEPNLQEWILELNNTPHTRGYTMKVEQRRPRLQPEEIYALADNDVSEREALDRLNLGDKTTATYTPRPSQNETAMNEVNATADPNTAKPTETSVKAVGHPKPLAKKTAQPGSKLQPSLWVPCSKHWKQRKQMNMDYDIEGGVTNSTLWTYKPSSPCNDIHWTAWGKSKGGKPEGDGGDKGGARGKGGCGDKGGVGGKGDKGEKKRRTGTDVGGGSQRSPLRRKKTSGTPLTLRWVSFLRES